jgi:3alpha(or 20beta)-hydroxysteroid dehydrogenase
MGSLTDQIVLIAGGAGAIGRATAQAIVVEGGRVMVADINRHAGEALVEALGDSASFVVCDITRREAWSEAVTQCANSFGPVTALVNDGGTTSVHRLEELSSEEMLELTRVNQFGAIYGMQAVFEPLRANGGGSIINVTSMAVHHGVGFNAGYAAAKAAVRAVSVCAALEWAPHGIRVNTIAPGMLATPMAQGAHYARLSNFDERVRAMVPLGRPGTVDQVAALTVFLLSDEGGFCTGADFVLDGGQSAGRIRELSPE